MVDIIIIRCMNTPDHQLKSESTSGSAGSGSLTSLRRRFFAPLAHRLSSLVWICCASVDVVGHSPIINAPALGGVTAKRPCSKAREPRD